MRALVDVLGDPQEQIPVIHITGTNGKGSTPGSPDPGRGDRPQRGDLLEPAPAADQRAHRPQRRPITDADLAQVHRPPGPLPLSGVGPAGSSPTAAAYRWFADVAVDVAVVEVGMLWAGTTRPTSDGSVAVTNVGPDHTDFQGDWRRAIAEEKAARQARPILLGQTDPELRSVFLDAGADEV